MKVFIYGTLKRGFALHDKGLKSSRYQGNVVTAVPYPLYIAGSFFGPIMLDKPGDGLPVEGELFEVLEDTLPKLDELEDVGQEESFRSAIRVSGSGTETAYAISRARSGLTPFIPAYSATTRIGTSYRHGSDEREPPDPDISAFQCWGRASNDRSR